MRTRTEAPRFLLSGYYGCGNTGDEAVLAGIASSFAQRGVDVELTVLSADPEDTRRRHGLSAVPRMRLGPVRRAIDSSDALLSGGGSLLQDVTSARSLVYYLWVAWYAAHRGLPVMFYAQGIGPLRRPLSRVLTRAVADRARHITVRDEASADLLRAIGVRHPPIEVTADPAFALQPVPQDRARHLLADAGAPADQRCLGLALRPWPRSPGAALYAQVVDRLAAVTGAHPVLLPMQPPGDLALADEVAVLASTRVTVLRQALAPAEAAAAVGAMAGLVAMRLHALIFAATLGVPVIALNYDPKVEQLMRRLGQAHRCVALPDLSGDTVSESMASAMGQGPSLRSALRETATCMAELALLNVDRALAVAA